MSHPFRYKVPLAEQVQTMAELAEYFSETYEQILHRIDPSAERTLAIRRLQEARMWANASVLGITISHD